MIFNIQKCSIHDGYGLRTLVFFKGCLLKCKWCANPESQSYKTEIMEFPMRCVGCGLCREVCAKKAIEIDGSINRGICNNCNKCTDICYAESKSIVGKEYTIEELYREIEKDKPFYEIYGGGVTFSGGEPFTQGKYLKDILKMCKEKSIHTTIESCGYAEYEGFKEALEYIDDIFIDIKHIDEKKHIEITGKSNKLIFENIKKITKHNIPITIRTPIVPGYTDEIENIKGIAEFICKLEMIKEYELLPYHNLGESKYKALGRKYELADVKIPTDEHIRELVRKANKILNEYNKECYWMKDNNKEVLK